MKQKPFYTLKEFLDANPETQHSIANMEQVHDEVLALVEGLNSSPQVMPLLYERYKNNGLHPITEELIKRLSITFN